MDNTTTIPASQKEKVGKNNYKLMLTLYIRQYSIYRLNKQPRYTYFDYNNDNDIVIVYFYFS
mgnify:CR=1 FL=1